MTRPWPRFALISALAVAAACSVTETGADPFELVIVGQALIKVDPRTSWPTPYASIRPIVEQADVAFTNFEMAVNGPGNECGVPAEYQLVLGEPRIPKDAWPGNVSNPHAVDASVMDFLSSMGFNLMSLSNNHIWDLGECGVRATLAAAERDNVSHAGAGRTLAEATAPAYLTVNGTTVALVAATTSKDERDLLRGTVNGVWTGHQEDWERNIAAVRAASRRADIVIYYQHVQLDVDEFAGLGDGQATEHGHVKVADIGKWQADFAKAVIDAGASIYVGHGHRGFDGVEIYKGRPIIRQLGGFAYQGLNPKPGAYDDDFAWWGLLARLTFRDNRLASLEVIPLELDQGDEYVGAYDLKSFLTRRGFAEVAEGPLAIQILERFRNLSAAYGATVVVKGDRGHVSLTQH